MSDKKTKGALFVEKLKNDVKLQNEFTATPAVVLERFGIDAEDIPVELAGLYAGAGMQIPTTAWAVDEGGHTTMKSKDGPRIRNVADRPSVDQSLPY